MAKQFLENAASVVVRASATAMIIAAASYCHAVDVTDWRTYKATNATVLAGQGTDDPIVGNLTGNPAQQSFLIGYLPAPAVLGTNTGDFVTLSFKVKFNDAVGIANQGDNFRWALWDLNGEAQDSATGGVGGSENYNSAGTTNTDQFRGYWFGHQGGGGAGAGGSIRERPADLVGGVTNPFTNDAGAGNPAPSLGGVDGENIPLNSDVNGNGAGSTYTGVMTLTRNDMGGIDLSGTFIGAGPDQNEFMATDATPVASTYSAVGFLMGNPLNIDQVIYTDIDVSVGSVSIGLVGDHNSDGVVDAADYVAWKKDPAAFGGDPDGYNDWVEGFGESSSGSGGGQGAAVPEPALLPLAGIAALVAFGVLRRRPQYARVIG